MELLYNQDILKSSINDDTKEVASESVGPHSKTYVNKSNLRMQQIMSKDELNNECYKMCYKRLVHTGLMYRGVH